MVYNNMSDRCVLSVISAMYCSHCWLVTILLVTKIAANRTQGIRKVSPPLSFVSFCLPHSVPLAMPVNLELTPSSFSMLQVSWGAAPGATQYMILYSALNHGEPDDAKEVGTGFLCALCVCFVCSQRDLVVTGLDNLTSAGKSFE